MSLIWPLDYQYTHGGKEPFLCGSCGQILPFCDLLKNPKTRIQTRGRPQRKKISMGFTYVGLGSDSVLIVDENNFILHRCGTSFDIIV